MRLRSIRTGRRCTLGRAAATRGRAPPVPPLRPRTSPMSTRIGRRFIGGRTPPVKCQPHSRPSIRIVRACEYTAPVDQAKLARPDALFGLPPNMNQMAGISDNRAEDTESWAFTWSNPDDENKMKAALETIAQQAMAPPPPRRPLPQKQPARPIAGRIRPLHRLRRRWPTRISAVTA